MFEKGSWRFEVKVELGDGVCRPEKRPVVSVCCVGKLVSRQGRCSIRAGAS